MKNFLDQDFLLQTDTARELYHEHAAKMPIIDYHCHLDPRQIAENHQFEDLTEIWLGGDHYKWRAMRANASFGRSTLMCGTFVSALGPTITHEAVVDGTVPVPSKKAIEPSLAADRSDAAVISTDASPDRTPPVTSTISLSFIGTM